MVWPYAFASPTGTRTTFDFDYAVLIKQVQGSNLLADRATRIR